MDQSLLESLKRREDELDRIVKEKTAALKKAPKGRLKFQKKKDRTEYYWVEPKTGKQRYITKNNMAFAIALAQKGYDEDALKRAKKELKVIRNAIRQIVQGTVENSYDILAKERQLLVNPIQPSDEEFREEWLKQDSCEMGFDNDAPEFYTANGERVRSKSEILIANTLLGNGVAYLFEHRINLVGYGTVYPDFCVLDLKKRKTIVWEHLGRMDDPAYVERNLRKINAYLKNGYVIGETLILTFESDTQPIDTSLIEKLIKHYFL